MAYCAHCLCRAIAVHIPGALNAQPIYRVIPRRRFGDNKIEKYDMEDEYHDF
jgi:hypothetical protein